MKSAPPTEVEGTVGVGPHGRKKFEGDGVIFVEKVQLYSVMLFVNCGSRGNIN